MVRSVLIMAMIVGIPENHVHQVVLVSWLVRLLDLEHDQRRGRNRDPVLPTGLSEIATFKAFKLANRPKWQLQ